MKTRTEIYNQTVEDYGDPTFLRTELLMTDHDINEMFGEKVLKALGGEKPDDGEEFAFEEFVVATINGTIYEDAISADACSADGYEFYDDAMKAFDKDRENSLKFIFQEEGAVYERPGLSVSVKLPKCISFSSLKREFKEDILHHFYVLMEYADCVVHTYTNFTEYLVGIPQTNAANRWLGKKCCSKKKYSERTYCIWPR